MYLYNIYYIYLCNILPAFQCFSVQPKATLLSLSVLFITVLLTASYEEVYPVVHKIKSEQSYPSQPQKGTRLETNLQTLPRSKRVIFAPSSMRVGHQLFSLVESQVRHRGTHWPHSQLSCALCLQASVPDVCAWGLVSCLQWAACFSSQFHWKPVESCLFPNLFMPVVFFSHL